MKIIVTKQGCEVQKYACTVCGLEAMAVGKSLDPGFPMPGCPNCGSVMQKMQKTEPVPANGLEAPAPKRKGGRPKGSGKKKTDSSFHKDTVGHCISCSHSMPKLDCKGKYECSIDLEDHDADDTCLGWQKWKSKSNKEAADGEADK